MSENQNNAYIKQLHDIFVSEGDFETARAIEAQLSQFSGRDLSDDEEYDLKRSITGVRKSSSFGDFAYASNAQHTVVNLMEIRWGQTHIKTLKAIAKLAQLQLQNREFEEAQECFLKVLRLASLHCTQEQDLINDAREGIQACTDAISMFESTKNLSQSMNEMMNINRTPQDADIVQSMEGLNQQASRYISAGQYLRAAVCIRRVLKHYKQTLKQTDQIYIDKLYTYAEVLRKADKFRKAAIVYAEMIQIFQNEHLVTKHNKSLEDAVDNWRECLSLSGDLAYTSSLLSTLNVNLYY